MVIFHSYVSLLEGNHIPYIHHFQINVLPAPTAGLLLRFENHLCLCAEKLPPHHIQISCNWGLMNGVYPPGITMGNPLQMEVFIGT